MQPITFKKLLLSLTVLCSFFSESYSQKTIQNIQNRNNISLNGRWSYIIDPYQMGYLDYRQDPFDESKSGKGGFYDT